MKLKPLLSLFSVGILTTTPIVSVSCTQKNRIVDWTDHVNYLDFSVVENLKKPDSWSNLFYDILLVNNLNIEDFDYNKNLQIIRNFYQINNSSLSTKIGQLEYFETQFIGIKIENILEEEYVNNNEFDLMLNIIFKNGDIINDSAIFNFKMLDDLNFWKSLKVNFKDFKNAWWSGNEEYFSLDFKNEELWKENSQFEVIRMGRNYVDETKIILEPGKKIVHKVDLLQNQYKVKGYISYEIPFNYNQFLILTDKSNKSFKINLSWSMWATANKSLENYFSEESQDLFILKKRNEGNPASNPPILKFILPGDWIANKHFELRELFK